MCGPQVAMAASLVIAAAGTAMSAAGSANQAKQQSAIMKRNVKVAEMQADDALERGREEESRHRLNVLRLAGEQTALLASSGVSLSDGTPVSILEDTFYMGELDAEIIRKNAEREAWGYRAQAGGYEQQASLYEQQGSYGVGTSLLSGASSMADTWHRWERGYTPPGERTAAVPQG